MLFDYTKTVKFQSPFSIEETQEKLAKVTANLVYSDLAPAIRFLCIGSTDGFLFSGKVSNGKVRLSRVKMYWHNSFKPYFYGKIVSIDNKVMLEGKFTMHTVVKIFVSIGLAITGVFCIMLIFGILDDVNGLIAQILIKLLTLSLIAGGLIIFVKAVKELGKKDIEWIKTKLKELGLTEVV